MNSTRVTRVLGTDVWDLSYAEWCSRRQMRQIAAFLRRYVPGFLGRVLRFSIPAGVITGVAAYGSYAVARAARAIRGRPSSSSLSRTT